MSALTAKQTFMENCLTRLFKRLNQELAKMEKMTGEKDSLEPVLERMIEQNIINIHEKITTSFPQASIFFENTTDFIPEDSNGSKFLVIPMGGIKNMEHAFEEAFVAMAFVDSNDIIQDAVVFNPFTEESFFASNNNGAFSLHARLRASKRKESCDIVSYMDAEKADAKEFQTVLNITMSELKVNNPIRVSQASLLDMILVAAGKKDAFIATGLTKQESLITKLFAQESGAIATDFKSKEITENTKSIVMASSKLHATMLQRLSNAE